MVEVIGSTESAVVVGCPSISVAGQFSSGDAVVVEGEMAGAVVGWVVVTSGLEDASGTEEEIMVSSVLVKSLGVVS